MVMVMVMVMVMMMVMVMVMVVVVVVVMMEVGEDVACLCSAAVGSPSHRSIQAADAPQVSDCSQKAFTWEQGRMALVDVVALGVA